MAITYTVFWETQLNAAGGDITSTSRSYTSGDLITALFVAEDNASAGTLSISNSGTAQTWTNIVTTNTTSNCKVAGWRCVMSLTQSMTISVACSGGNAVDSAIAVIQHNGQHASTPVPAGNIFSGVGTTDVSQLITPTASGSALWMIAGDWGATNSFVARANCTVDQTVHSAGAYSGALIRPTTQPRTDANAFTIGETDTAGTITWLAFEVQAAAGGPVIILQPQNQSVRVGDIATFSVEATDATGYDWEVDTGGGFANAPGTQTNSVYTTGVLAIGDHGDIYRCNVSNAGGTTVSASATLNVHALAAASLGGFDAELRINSWF